MSHKRMLEALDTGTPDAHPTMKRFRRSSLGSIPAPPVDNIAVYLDPRTRLPSWLPKNDLSRQSKYFAGFDRRGWPQAFTLRPRDDGNSGFLQPEYVDAIVQPEAIPHGDSVQWDYSSASQLHHHLLRLLSFNTDNVAPTEGKPLAKFLLDTALLAQSYGCIRAVKDGLLVSAWAADTKVNSPLLQDPFKLLHMAMLLEDKPLYRASFRHAAGQRAANVLNDDVLPRELERAVDRHAQSIADSVSRICRMLVLPSSRLEGLSGFIAWSLFHHHLLERVTPTPVAGKQRFQELFYIYNLGTGLDLTSTPQGLRVMGAVRTIDLGMERASNALLTLEDEYREERHYESQDLDTALDEDLKPKVIRACLQQAIQHAQRVLRPLFCGEIDIQYFTHLPFEGEYLWETGTVDSPNTS